MKTSGRTVGFTMESIGDCCLYGSLLEKQKKIAPNEVTESLGYLVLLSFLCVMRLFIPHDTIWLLVGLITS